MEERGVGEKNLKEELRVTVSRVHEWLPVYLYISMADEPSEDAVLDNNDKSYYHLPWTHDTPGNLHMCQFLSFP